LFLIEILHQTTTSGIEAVDWLNIAQPKAILKINPKRSGEVDSMEFSYFKEQIY